MNLKEIQDLIEFISRRDFAQFEMENEGFKLRLVRAGVIEASPPAAGDAARAVAAPLAAPAVQPAPAAAPRGAAAPADGLHEITSPIVGTFYRSPNPTSPPFVENGTVIRKGQPLCIVEAMKLMNEIEADVEGEVVEVMVANGQPVEYGEVLFRVRLSAA